MVGVDELSEAKPSRPAGAHAPSLLWFRGASPCRGLLPDRIRSAAKRGLRSRYYSLAEAALDRASRFMARSKVPIPGVLLRLRGGVRQVPGEGALGQGVLAASGVRGGRSARQPTSASHLPATSSANVGSAGRRGNAIRCAAVGVVDLVDRLDVEPAERRPRTPRECRKSGGRSESTEEEGNSLIGQSFIGSPTRV